mmetsp:Transcript_16754/g.20142  ORF Transcript_16754/g.20142 Transcript_16754/m.20142 type:complete len:225 (-) Transcript_16754:47-721(-)
MSTAGQNPTEVSPDATTPGRQFRDSCGSQESLGDGTAERVFSSSTATVLTKLEKWGDYPCFGTPVYKTCMIPMKTPLSIELCKLQQLQTQGSFTLTHFLEEQERQHRKVGMIIDLSNHECLYSEDIPDHLNYAHVRCVAKALPDNNSVQEVIRHIRTFLAEHPGEYIGIHCAYGFNRTGFVVCSYLIEEFNLDVDTALSEFATARSPGKSISWTSKPNLYVYKS